MSNIATENEALERRARRSSESMTSVEWRRLKQPVSASRTLFSCASLNSSAFFTDAPSSAAAAGRPRRGVQPPPLRFGQRRLRRHADGADGGAADDQREAVRGVAFGIGGGA